MFKSIFKAQKEQLDLQKYGTSAGATAGWDTRGRGRKDMPKKEETLNAYQKKFKGGLSHGVINAEPAKSYIGTGGFVGGYLGHAVRTTERDKAVESHLRAQGLGDSGIATWLTSTSGRHLGNAMEGVAVKDLKAVLDRNAGGAFKDVVVWSHPDHAGTMASTNELHDKIAAAYKDHTSAPKEDNWRPNRY
jgi:hypothetical protein